MSQKLQKSLFFFLYSALFLATNQPYIYAEAGIDPSWWASLVMAIERGTVFGTEFIFNYGPLGFLNTLLLPKGMSPLVLFIFHLFLLANFLFICHLSFLKLGKKWKGAAVVAVLILLPWGFIADASFTLFYLLLFWLLYVKATHNTIPLFIALLITLFIFYIKVNLSLIALAIYIGSLLYLSLKRSITWRTTGVLISCFIVLVWLFSLGLHVEVFAYLASSIEIIDAYQDAMTVKLVEGAELWIMLAFFFLILASVLFFIVTNLAYFTENIYVYLLVGLACFLGFKQAFTATGHYNIFGFFLLLPPLAVLLFLFTEHKFKNSSKRLVIVVLVLQLLATQFIRLSYMNYDLRSYALFAFPDKVAIEYRASPQLYQLLKVFKYKNLVNYLSDLFTYDYQMNFERKEIVKDKKLPSKILQSVGNASIDVVPWETSYVFFNKLNYKNRPVIQSYQANSGWLAGKNEEMYFSVEAPDFVLAGIKSFREQNPYWIDGGVYKALRYRYHLKDTVELSSDTLYLFQKGMASRRAEEIVFPSKHTSLGEIIPVPTDSADLYHYGMVNYNWKGKIARLFFQPPYLWLKVTYEDNTYENFRVPPPIAAGGLYVSHRVVAINEFLNLHNGLSSKNKKLKSLTYWSDQDWGFDKNLSFHFSKIKR